MSEPALLSSSEAAPADDGRYVLHYGDLRTGRLIATFPAKDASWSTELLASGSASVDVPVGDLAAEVWRNTPVGATMWAVEWADQGGRRIVAAGPVWSKSFSDDGAKYGGSGIYSVFAKRRLVPNVGFSSVPKNDLTFSGLDLGSIIRAIVEHLTGLLYGDLPVVLEPARAGSHDRTYKGYEAAWSDQRIKELHDVDGGAEFDFQPRLSADALHVEWVLTTGTEAQPQVMSDTTFVLDGTAPQQKVVRNVSGEFDASTMATTAWAIGAGTERAQVVRGAVDTTLTDAGFPRLEADTSSDSEDGALVQQYANGLLARTKRPARSVKVDVAASYWYGLGARLGDRVRLLYNHPLVGPLDVTSRVIGEAGSLNSRWVSLTLADTIAEEVF